jgi:predicted dehydrogenase
VGPAPPGTHCTIDLPHVKHYRDLESFLEDDEIKLVMICTAPDTHAELAIACLNAGKNGVYP